MEDNCHQLDRILSIVPSLKPSNIQEIENVNRLYQAIAEAQLSINYVLLNDKTGQVDVAAEQQLVASAIDFVVSNQEAFGKKSLFIPKWWLTQFDKPTSDSNTPVALQYFNQIKTWIDTLEEHVLEDISNDETLIQFYSSAFTNHFKSLT